MALAKNNKMDMCQGPLLPKIIKFAIPLIVTTLLQQLFHAADLMVIGRFSTYQSMAAIGATATIFGMLVNVFMGVSVGVNVLVAQYFGAKDNKNTIHAVHTAVAVALLLGFLMMITGFILCDWLLKITDVPAEIFQKSKLYLMIIIAGFPFLMLYNFCCAIMRAIGDTKRPLYYLTTAGIVNVLLNLLFVVVFKMDVAGVAFATIASQAVSTFFVIRALMRSHGSSRLVLRNIRIDWFILKRILYLGIPAGIQSGCFALSNMLMQGGINYFGAACTAGNTIVLTLEWFSYSIVYGLHHTAIAFVGQNYGGKQYDRVRRSFWNCLTLSAIAVFMTSMVILIFGKPLMMLFNNDPQVIAWGMIRLKILFFTNVLISAMDTISGALRGLGYTVLPTVTNLIFTALFRILWLEFVFRAMTEPRLEVLLYSYPLSWFLSAAVNYFFLHRGFKKLSDSNGKYIAVK